MNPVKKMAVFIVRVLYYIVGLSFHYLERAANWMISYHKKTEYIKEGACVRCGRCCRLLAIQYPKWFEKFPRLVRFTIGWHEMRYNFTYFNREGYCFLYRCNWLKEDGSCRVYRWRPRLCREYPKLGLYGKPPKHPTCGFYFVRRDGRATFDEALHRASHKFPD